MKETKKKVQKAATKKSPKDPTKDLKKQIEELKGDLLRARADYDNFRKRKEKEILETRDRAITNFVEDILPAIDNFEMSLKMTDNTEMFVKGVEMIHKNLTDTLKEYKIEEINAKEGDPFDPTLHDPILIEDESKEKGKITKVLRKGYKHKEKVIRPIRVEVPKE